MPVMSSRAVTGLRHYFCAVLAASLMAALYPNLASAFDFWGVDVDVHDQDYIVTTDVNIRAKPKTKSKKLGQFKKFERVHAVGQAPGSWVAVQKGDLKIGFVYQPALIAVLNGELDKPIVGDVKKKNAPACHYTIIYQGKSIAEGQLFDIADYDVRWRCRKDDIVTEFVTPMFMTEGPFKKSKSPTFQITVDIVDPESDLDEVVSTTVFYDRDNNMVKFDGISIARFAGKPAVTEIAANSLHRALKAGVEMSFQAWPSALWKVLLKL